MLNKRLLIADNNKMRLENLRSNLVKEVDEIILAMDGASALESMLKNRPNIAIVDVDLPVISGGRLFQILKNNPQTRDIPFIFIGERVVEINGFRRGFDQFLSKPFNINDIYLKIQEIFANPPGSTPETIQLGTEIEGKLSHLSLADLLQVISMNKKEGVLHVSNHDMEGRIYIRDGEIYNAVLSKLEREKALFRMLAWKDGSFEFRPQPVDMPQKIKTSTNNLLIDGLRQYDEWKKNKDYFPKPESYLTLKVDVKGLPGELKPIIEETLRLVDLYPMVEDLIEHSTYPDLEVYKVLALLIKKGAIEVSKEVDRGRIRGELLSSYQALKIFERLFSYPGESESVSYGKILVLSLNSSIVKTFMEMFKGIKGFSVAPELFAANYSGDFFGETGILRIDDSSEFVFFTIPFDDKLKPLGKAFSKNMIGIIILWDKTTRSDEQFFGFKSFLHSLANVPLINIFLSEERIDENKELQIKKNMRLGKDEQFYTLYLKESHDKVFCILYNLFGAFLKGHDYVY